MIRPSLLVLTTVAAAACAPAASLPPTSGAGTPAVTIETLEGAVVRLGDTDGVATVVVEASPDRVWSVLPQAYERLGIQVDVIDRAGRSYGTRGFTRSRLADRRTEEFVRCGAQGLGPGAGFYRMRLTIISTVRDAPGGHARLATEMGGLGTPADGTSTSGVRCVSTGKLEQRIHHLVAELLAG